MQLFVEIRSTVQRNGKIQLVPLADVNKYTGFRSVYCFDEAAYAQILANKSTANLRDMAVYSDTLFVDFDDTDSTAFRQYLIDNNIGFERWDSGSRSVHFHIPIQNMYGPDTAQRQKAWMKEHAPTADLSIYHNAAMYRLPRTYHAKTSKPKVLLERVAGNPLVIPELEVRDNTHNLTATAGGSIEMFYINLVTRKGTGGRRPWLFLLAVQACEIGLSFDEAIEHLCWWNERFCSEPHPYEVIEQQTRGGYAYAGRKYGSK